MVDWALTADGDEQLNQEEIPVPHVASSATTLTNVSPVWPQSNSHINPNYQLSNINGQNNQTRINNTSVLGQ